jgi:glycosyltransferase involved in cell wall biosynthesis
MRGPQAMPFRLLVFSSARPGDGYGSSTALLTFLEVVLAESAWQVTLVVPAPVLPALHHERLRIIAVRASGGRLRQLLLYALAAVRRAWSVRDLRPDFVLSWQPLPAALAGWLASARHRVPHIVRTSGPELARTWSRFPVITSALQPLTRCILRRADAIVVKSYIERSLLPRSAARVRLIPNAVDGRFFVPPSAGESSVTRLLVVCELEPCKGVMRLMEAIGEKRVRLTVAGDGSERIMLERAAAARQIDAAFLGYVAHAALPELYASHDALVVPSNVEGCSNAVLEAMAAGLPVIGMRAALGELVEDGVHGFVAATTADLPRALDRFLAWQARGPMQHAARRRAAMHSPARLLTAYAELMRELSGGAG